MQVEPPAAGAARRRHVTRPAPCRRRVRPLAWAVVVALIGASCSSESATTSSATSPGTPVATPATDAAASTVAPVEAAPADTAPAETPAPTTTEPATIQLNGPAVVDRPATAGVVPEGFSAATVRITEADGTVCEVCMWLADDVNERSRGLMGVTDLGDAVGMAFVFDVPISSAFYMFQTVTPLSIAWFDSAGEFGSSTDMDPCLDELAANCPRYPPTAEFQLAIEVFQGDLAGLGIAPGSRAEVVAGSESDTCPLAE